MNDFELFMSQLSETNTTLRSLTDFGKVSANVRKIAIKLNQLNYLLGKEDLRTAIHDIYEENPKAFDVLDILVAVRSKEKKKVLDNEFKPKLMENYFKNETSICEFMHETGLENVFRTKQITNLVDYVFGVEVGLDSNARKNRGGNIMAEAIARKFRDAGVPFRQEVYSTEFKEIQSLGTDLKRFDFVIQTDRAIYLIEANYYNGGGSKLNEVARSYSEIAPKINQYPDYQFVWITDGQGWFSAKSKLEEAFRLIPHVYNLTSLDEFIQEVKTQLP